MRRSLALFLILSSYGPSAFGAKPAPLYRIVHTSPKELLSALLLAPASGRVSEGSTSRFMRYFRVMRKEVSGPHITMHVQVDARYFPAELAKYGEFVVAMTEIERSAELQRYGVRFTAPMTEMAGVMEVTPYGQGESLLKYTITKSNMPEWMVQRIVDVATRLNLASSTPITHRR